MQPKQVRPTRPGYSLLEGADPNLANFAGRVPIQTAPSHGHDELVEILSEATRKSE
jgi:hypothetical protein